MYEWFNISTDHFGRTSTDKQREIVHEIFNDLDKNGMLCEKEVQQLYSPELPGFLADRFVEGTCPKESLKFKRTFYSFLQIDKHILIQEYYKLDKSPAVVMKMPEVTSVINVAV